MEEYDDIFDKPHTWPAIGSKFIAIITPQGRLILERKPYLSGPGNMKYCRDRFSLKVSHADAGSGRSG
ncbi:MAG: hypothetical protein ACI30O_07915, partial [Muribaculaceae bacterium]